MARTSIRNFLTAFRAVGIDDAEAGPEISQDVQMTYQVDDLRESTYIDAGAGSAEGAVVAEHGFLTLQCRVPSGLLITQVSMHDLTPTDGLTLLAWTSGVVPTVTGIATMLSVLRTTGLQGLPAAPLSIASRATIPTANIPADTFRFLNTAGFNQPFFINEGQFFNACFLAANVAVDLGIRWRELRLFP